LIDRLMNRRPGSNWRGAWMLIAAAPLGAALYSGYIYYLTGDPFAWVTAQHAWGGRLQPFAFITRRWHILQDRGLDGYLRFNPSDLLAFMAAVTMIGTGLWLLWRRRWLYGGLMLAYLSPAVAIDLPATGRLTAVVFPMFIVLGAWCKGRTFFGLASLFAAGQIWFAWRFFIWKTPY
jgi:hypothetical protein